MSNYRTHYKIKRRRARLLRAVSLVFFGLLLIISILGLFTLALSPLVGANLTAGQTTVAAVVLITLGAVSAIAFDGANQRY